MYSTPFGQSSLPMFLREAYYQLSQKCSNQYYQLTIFANDAERYWMKWLLTAT